MIYFLITFFMSHYLYLGMGRTFGNSIFRCCRITAPIDKLNEEFDLEDLLFWCLGFLTHLWLTYLLYRLGLNLQYAFSLILITTIAGNYTEHFVTFEKLKKAYFRLIRNGFPISFLVYFFIVSGIGLTIISHQLGLVTYWGNNYSDFSFHLGMITNFAFNNERLTDYHIFPGVPLSYYFFINFWTACFLIEPNNWNLLCLIYLFQWISSWTIIYFTFSFFKSEINSYLLLFGGGTFTVLFRQLSSLYNGEDALPQLSHHFIEKGYPWTVFLSCIWIPQRGATLGLGILVVAMTLWSSLKSRPSIDRQAYEVLIGITIVLAFMVHFYFALVGILIISFSIINRLVFLRFSKRELLGDCKFFLISLIFTLPSIYLLHTKNGLLKFTGFWMPWKSLSGSQALDYSIGGAIAMWGLNACAMFILFFLIFRKKYILETFPLIVIFIIFNLFQFSVWDWDTYKAFIGIYCILVCFYTVYNKKTLWRYPFVLLIVLPGVMETLISLSLKEPYGIYSETDLDQAKLLRQRTAEGIIIGKPDHNSIITAAGRTIFIGYPGWLATHSIDYLARASINDELLGNFSCKTLNSIEEKPIYLYSKTPLANESSLIPDPVMPNLYDLRSICE